MTSQREQFLLFRIRTFQDNKAFSELFLEYSPNLQRYLTSRLPSRQDAEDLFSEVTLRVWNFALTNHIDSFLGLALGVARNLVADFYKHREKHSDLSLTTDLAEETLGDEGHKRLINEIDAKMLMDAIQESEDEEVIQIIHLRYVEGYRVKDIAQLLGKTENVISAHIYRSLKRIKDRFEKMYPGV